MATPDPLTAALSSFARTLAQDCQISDVLHDLTERVAEAIAVPSAGVSLLHRGDLQHAASLNELAATIEAEQERAQQGPSVDACRTAETVIVPDLRTDGGRWPAMADAVLATGVVAIAGIPLSVRDQPLGALNLYDVEPRQWSGEDLARARILADMATSYVVNAAHLERERRANEHLQQALENRVVIEQAKGILASHHGISVSEAFERLRAHARSHNATTRSVADAVVNLGMRV